MKKYNIINYGAVPNSGENQRDAIQKVLDMCAKSGGVVEIPAGEYICDSLRMYSNTTLLLKKGAKLLGNDNVYDYKIIEFPKGMESRSDIEMIAHYYAPPKPPIPRYRCAIISIVAQRNVSIIGEDGAVIDGQDCFDPEGEEGYRGPHGIYITNCENVILRGYIIKNTGNFMHQIDNCMNLVLDNIVCLGGSDATHLHCCRNITITNCDFRTGDDCIAGIDVKNLHVDNCQVNTSCHSFRIGGVNMLVENSHFYGPGIYPHRATIVKGKDDILPITEGRHNTQQMITYFSSDYFPAKTPACNWYFRNCKVEGIDAFLHYHENSRELLHSGVPLVQIRMENMSFSGIKEPSYIVCTKDNPLHIEMKNVTGDELFAASTPNLVVTRE